MIAHTFKGISSLFLLLHSFIILTTISTASAYITNCLDWFPSTHSMHAEQESERQCQRLNASLLDHSLTLNTLITQLPSRQL